MGHISKKTALFIALLILIPLVVASLAIMRPAARQVATAPTPTPLPPALQPNSVLSITDEQSPSASTKNAAVMLTTGPNKVTGVQVELTYDPTAITNVTLTPGTFFSQPAILLNKVDQTKGTISYVIAIQPTDNGKTGSGSVLNISYTLLQGSNAAKNLFTFTPKAVVTAEGTLETVLKETRQ